MCRAHGRMDVVGMVKRGGNRTVGPQDEAPLRAGGNDVAGHSGDLLRGRLADFLLPVEAAQDGPLEKGVGIGRGERLICRMVTFAPSLAAVITVMS